MPYNHEQFVGEVLSKSHASDLQAALEEWTIIANFHEEESSCFCGHAISDVFSLRNYMNGNTLPYVGSKCVKRFGPKMCGLMGRVKQGRKRVKKGKLATLSFDAICRDHFSYVKWLSRTGPKNKEQRDLLDYARWVFGPKE